MLFLKNWFVPIALPVAALFAFLFYLFWSAPLSLLLQIYHIDHWYILNNDYLKIVLIITGILLIVFAVLYLLSFKIAAMRWSYLALVGLLVFAFTAALLYPTVFPYNYGAFIDDGHLIPTLSLLGFSKARYALDALLLGGAMAFTLWSIRKNFAMHFFFVVLLYYTAETGLTVFKAAGRFSASKDAQAPLLVSENHPNIFYFIYDGFGPSEVNYFLTNGQMPEELTSWTKDFTFYSNVTSLSTIYTVASLPNMYEGYQKTPQILLDAIVKKDLSYDYVYMEPLLNFKKSVSPYAHVVENKAPSVGNSTPLLQPRLYAAIPYFLRHILAREFSWKYSNLTRWITRGSPALRLQSALTEKAFIFHQFDDYTHHPWSSRKVQVSNLQEQGNSPQKLEEILFENTKDTFEFIAHLIALLKELDIYENTKIIFASDHDTHTDRGEISFNLLRAWGRPVPEIGCSYDIHSLLMIKELGASKPRMAYDGRFLTLADIRGNIERSLGLRQIPDFIGEDYVPRIVHIPQLSYGNFHNLLKNSNEKKKLPKEITFNRLSNIAPYHNIGSISVPIEALTSIPTYEIIK